MEPLNELRTYTKGELKRRFEEARQLFLDTQRSLHKLEGESQYMREQFTGVLGGDVDNPLEWPTIFAKVGMLVGRGGLNHQEEDVRILVEE